MKWIIDNCVSLVVLAVVAAVVALIVIKMIRDKKQGKSSCSCGCGGCAMKDSCHAKKQRTESGENIEYISINIE